MEQFCIQDIRLSGDVTDCCDTDFLSLIKTLVLKLNAINIDINYLLKKWRELKIM